MSGVNEVLAECAVCSGAAERYERVSKTVFCLLGSICSPAVLLRPLCFRPIQLWAGRMACKGAGASRRPSLYKQRMSCSVRMISDRRVIEHSPRPALLCPFRTNWLVDLPILLICNPGPYKVSRVVHVYHCLRRRQGRMIEV